MQRNTGISSLLCDQILHGLAELNGGDLPCGNLNGLAGLGILGSSRRSLFGFKDAEASDVHFVVFLHSLGDGVEHHIDGGLSVLLGQVDLFADDGCKLFLGRDLFPPGLQTKISVPSMERLYFTIHSQFMQLLQG